MELGNFGRGDHALSPPSLGIFWDVKSCPIPEGLNHADVVNNIKVALRDHVPDHNLNAFVAYNDPDDFSCRLLLYGMHEGMKIYNVHGPGVAYRLYKQMLNDVLGFSLRHSFPRLATVVLISREKHIEELIAMLLLRGYRVVLVISPIDRIARNFRKLPDFLLLDWLSVTGGSGKVIPKDDRRYEGVVEG